MKKSKFWNITANDNDAPASLLLYGELSNETWFGDEVTPRAFHDDLQSLGGKDIEVHINSPGGDVFAGQAIYNQLKAYAGKVKVVIDGMCASAATIVAMAGDVIIMPSNAIFMIHNPMVGVCDYYINEQDLSRLNDSLKAIKQTIVNVYMSRVKNLTEKQISRMMDAETWMTADEAISYGFADVIDDTVDVNNAVFANCVNYAQGKYKNFTPTKVGRKERESVTIEDIKALIQGKQSTEEAVGAAVKVERERISALNAMRDGSECINQMVDYAIENDVKPENIQAFVDIVKAQVKTAPATDKGLQELKALIVDQMKSGAADIVPVPAVGRQEGKDSAKQNTEDVIAAMQKYIK